MIASEIQLFDDTDMPWIAKLLDVVDRSLGEPWRVLVERIEHAPLRAHPSRIALVADALRRFAGSRAERARIARRARALVLGEPALARDARDARLAAAAAVLGVPPDEVETILWSDLAMERPVVLPLGRPSEASVAAFANLERIQRAVRRAREVRIVVTDDAHDLVRTVARCGLQATFSRDGDSTVLDICGPLTLFHATTVYGRALAALVPLLAEHEYFTLDIECEFDGRLQTLHVEPPALLPHAPPSKRRRPSIAEQLARDLAEAGHTVERTPEPVASGNRLLFADLIVDGWHVEVIGFCTAEYLAHKLAGYRSAGVERILLCIDSARGHAAGPAIVSHRGRIPVEAVTAAMQRSIAAASNEAARA